MRNRSTVYFLISFVVFYSSCTGRYAIVKTNRGEQNINSGIPPDSAIIKTYLPYKTQIDAEMNKVIGHSEVSLTKGSKLPETIVGNFFADAVAHQAKKIEPNIDIIFPTTNGGIRVDIAKGPITVSSIFEMMPFENQLILFTLKGEDVLKMLKFIASTNGQPIAGLKMEIKDGQPLNIFVGGKPFSISGTYNVLTSDYIGSGGDDTIGFSTALARKAIGLKVRDALLKEVMEMEASGKKINTTLDGRITKYE